jgi:hypothetical protein
LLRFAAGANDDFSIFDGAGPVGDSAASGDFLDSRQWTYRACERLREAIRSNRAGGDGYDIANSDI